MLFDYNYFNFVLAELVGRIASDQLIIEDTLKPRPACKLSSKLIKSLSKRNKFNVDLLSQLVFIGREIDDFDIKTANLLEAIILAKSALQAVDIKLNTSRVKPLVDVIGEARVLSAIIRMTLDIIILDDLSISELEMSLRRRGDFVTLRIAAPKIATTASFTKDILEFIDKLIKNYGGSIKFVNSASQRLVFIRMRLSNQIPLLYNKKI